MDKPPDEIVTRTDHDGVAILTLNRPRARNALSVAMLERLHDANLLADAA